VSDVEDSQCARSEAVAESIVVNQQIAHLFAGDGFRVVPLSQAAHARKCAQRLSCVEKSSSKRWCFFRAELRERGDDLIEISNGLRSPFQDQR